MRQLMAESVLLATNSHFSSGSLKRDLFLDVLLVLRRSRANRKIGFQGVEVSDPEMLWSKVSQQSVPSELRHVQSDAVLGSGLSRVLTPAAATVSAPASGERSPGTPRSSSSYWATLSFDHQIAALDPASRSTHRCASASIPELRKTLKPALTCDSSRGSGVRYPPCVRASFVGRVHCPAPRSLRRSFDGA